MHDDALVLEQIMADDRAAMGVDLHSSSINRIFNLALFIVVATIPSGARGPVTQSLGW
jgi:hypothetical protein